MPLATPPTATSAAAIPIVEAFGHNEQDNFGGNILDLYNGSGMNGVSYPNDQESWPPATDPSTWTSNSTSYLDEWQSMALVSGGSNGKIGWAAIDLGAVNGLHKVYLWHIRENNQRVAATYNLYVAAPPTIALVHDPTNSTASDYDFAGGGWTHFNTAGPLNANLAAVTTIDLPGVAARYLAIGILFNHGDSYQGGRVGFDEIAVTAAPPGSDGDGLPDWWEELYFGNPTAAHPDDDSDNDGRTNLREYQIGTHPLLADADGVGDWYEVAIIDKNPALGDPPNSPNDSSLKPNIPYPLPAPDPADTGVATKPVKVCIMAGQSNMVGCAPGIDRVTVALPPSVGAVGKLFVRLVATVAAE